jgi:hypothetical protein
MISLEVHGIFIFVRMPFMSIFNSISLVLNKVELGGTLYVGDGGGLGLGNLGSLGRAWGEFPCLVYTCNSLFLIFSLYSSYILFIISILSLLDASLLPSSSCSSVILRDSWGDMENVEFMV